MLHPERAKIVSDGPIASGIFDSLESLPASIRPDPYAVVDGTRMQSEGATFVIPDERQHKALFGESAYVAMLENSVLLGRFASGAERSVCDAYGTAFQLTVG